MHLTILTCVIVFTFLLSAVWSMWKCRTVPCPWGTGKPACETILLHHDQASGVHSLIVFLGVSVFVLASLLFSAMAPTVEPSTVDYPLSLSLSGEHLLWQHYRERQKFASVSES